MPDSHPLSIHLKKEPKQARSSDLVAAILEAALLVLEESGVQGFTTARVAERAGVSPGSLYQYFPNKESILFRLQSEEWEETTAAMEAALCDTALSHWQRLDRLVHEFIRSECDEATYRIALDEAAPLYRNTPEAKQIDAKGDRVMRDFVTAAFPHLAEEDCRRAADLVLLTVTSVGDSFSQTTHSQDEIDQFSRDVCVMLRAYLETVSS